PFGCNQQTANAIIGEQPGIGPKTPLRIDDSSDRLRACDLPDRQLRIVSHGRSHADNDDIDQRAQPVKVLNTGWAIDVLRMSRRRRNSPIERLAELANHNEIVYSPIAQRTE